MGREANRLTARGITTKPPGRHADGGGLYLLVRENGARSWVFRYMLAGKRHDLGLGPAGNEPGAVSLAEARRQTGELRTQMRGKIDPASVRKAEKTSRLAEATQSPQTAPKTFRDVAQACIAVKEAEWSNAKHAYQWKATLEQFAYPHFGDVPVADIVTGHVKAALEPIWLTKTETAVRLRGRVETILDYATTLEWRTGPNPARWKGHLANLLPAPSKVATTKHYPSLPWSKVGLFLAALREVGSTSALAIELLILTASRSQEVLKATWREIDWDAAIWTRPAGHMKGKIEHQQPLSPAALAVLKKAQSLATKTDPDAFIFPGQPRDGAKREAGLSEMTLTMLIRRMNRVEDDCPMPWVDKEGAPAVPHGFRATFRTWADDATAFDQSTKEAALAHVEKDKVVRAYARSDLMKKRRDLLDAWAEHCARVLPEAGNVVPLRAAGA
jgi:integrase